jgi:CheY-like chemotaxis protein
MPVSNCALVVEDDTAPSYIFQQVLVSLGLSVTGASNGATALDCLRRNKYDIIILDLLLPRISGLELLQHRLHLERFRECPIVVVTAHVGLRDEVQLGPRDHFLLKPVFLRDLYNTVSGVFPRFDSISP